MQYPKKKKKGLLPYLSKCTLAFAENVKLLSFWGHIKRPRKPLLPLGACTMAHNLTSDELEHQKGKISNIFQKNKMIILAFLLDTLVCFGGPFPIFNWQNAFVLPIVCFKLFPRLMVTVRHPGKQCSKLSALSWKLGGQVFMSNCSMGMASAATRAWALATSSFICCHDSFNRQSVSSTDSWAASLPVLSAPTRCGMHRVAASEVRSFLKLLNITNIVRRTSSFMVAPDQSSFSNAAAKRVKDET